MLHCCCVKCWYLVDTTILSENEMKLKVFIEKKEFLIMLISTKLLSRSFTVNYQFTDKICKILEKKQKEMYFYNFLDAHLWDLRTLYQLNFKISLVKLI